MTHTVLALDDDPIVRASLELLLESYGFQVALARTTRQAVAAFPKLEPDILLADLFMPEHDGVGAIAEIRRLRPDAKIVAMSEEMGSEPQHQALARKLGADALIAKPFEADDLIGALHDLLLPEHRIPDLALAA